MLNYRLKNVFGFCLVILCLHLQNASALNDTEKNSSDSFVVSANYGVQSEHTITNSPQNSENSNGFLPTAFQKYEGYTEKSLFANDQYKGYSKNYSPTTQDKNAEGLGSTRQGTKQNTVGLESFSQSSPTSYGGNGNLLPQPSEWRANFISNSKPCSQYEGLPQSSYIPHTYYGIYGGQSESTTTAHPLQENYFQKGLNRNEASQNFVSLSPKSESNIQNSQNIEYHGRNKVFSSSAQDRTLEIGNSWPSGHLAGEDLNNSHKPNMLELQEMINKIVQGNSKVHQVLKVPAVYEIHLQEDENKPSGLGSVGLDNINNNGIHSSLPQGSTQNRQPYKQVSSPPQRKKRLPNKPRPNKRPQQFRGGTKMWNLPSKIKYFDNGGGLNGGAAPIYGKYPYPQAFSSKESAKEIPLQNWYNSPNFDRTLPTRSPVYGSVNVPMTPGTTEVTFLDYGANLDHHNKFDGTLLNSPNIRPDLSNYYAKKKEIENGSFTGKNNSYRRAGGNDIIRRNSRRNYGTNLRQREERNFLPLSNLNYIIYIREKSRG